MPSIIAINAVPPGIARQMRSRDDYRSHFWFVMVSDHVLERARASYSKARDNAVVAPCDCYFPPSRATRRRLLFRSNPNFLSA